MLLEQVPLIYMMVVQFLQYGTLVNYTFHTLQDAVTEAVYIILDLGLTLDVFRDAIMNLLMEPKSQDDFNQLPIQIKSLFTKTYNNIYKTSVKA